MIVDALRHYYHSGLICCCVKTLLPLREDTITFRDEDYKVKTTKKRAIKNKAENGAEQN